jgi:hypothetical protein
MIGIPGNKNFAHFSCRLFGGGPIGNEPPFVRVLLRNLQLSLYQRLKILMFIIVRLGGSGRAVGSVHRDVHGV